MGSSKKKATKPRARKSSEPKSPVTARERRANAKAAASTAAAKPKPKRNGKPLPSARPTNRAKHPKGPEQQPTEQPATDTPVGLVPGLHTRRGGRVTRRMTFYFPPELAERVEREAFEQRVSVSVLGQRIFEERYAGTGKRGAA